MLDTVPDPFMGGRCVVLGSGTGAGVLIVNVSSVTCSYPGFDIPDSLSACRLLLLLGSVKRRVLEDFDTRPPSDVSFLQETLNIPQKFMKTCILFTGNARMRHKAIA